MRLSPREQWFLAVAAPVLVFATYFAAVRPPLDRRAASARARIAAAQTNERSDPSGWIRAVDQRTKELAALDERERACTAAERAFLADWPAAEARSTAIARVGELVRKAGVRVESTRRADAAEAVPSRTQSRLARLASELGAAAPIAWRLDLRAGYASLSDALDALAEAPSIALPLAIRAEPRERFTELGCTLWIWI